jgi:hypothetical protein
MCLAVRYPFPEAEKVLYTFQSVDDLARWRIFTDQEFGGRTTAALSQMAEPPVWADVQATCLIPQTALVNPRTLHVARHKYKTAQPSSQAVFVLHFWLNWPPILSDCKQI